MCHPSAPRGTKHSISLLPHPLRWSEGWVPLSTPSPMGSRFLAPILPGRRLPMSCERGAHAGTPHTGEVQLACFSCPGCSHHTQQLSPVWSHGRFHLISSAFGSLPWKAAVCVNSGPEGTAMPLGELWHLPAWGCAHEAAGGTGWCWHTGLQAPQPQTHPKPKPTGVVGREP